MTIKERLAELELQHKALEHEIAEALIHDPHGTPHRRILGRRCAIIMGPAVTHLDL
jgi:hypothetical protein